jgi:site-specific DNA-cytosine methylase
VATDLEQIDQRLQPTVIEGLHAPHGDFTALGVLVFAGGFSFGMEQAGFRVAGQLELPDLQIGVEAVRRRWPVHVGPVESWFGLTNKPDVIYANPPCVAYAATGNRGGAADSRMCYLRNATYDFSLKVQPTVWVWELVCGIFDTERGFLEAMAVRAAQYGYKCYAFLTTTAQHGGYQNRERFHFIASRVELSFDEVWNAQPAERIGVRPIDEALDACDVDGLTNNTDVYNGCFNAIMPYCPPGSHLRTVDDDIMRKYYKPNGGDWDGATRPGFAHIRARRGVHSPTVLGGPTIIHPDKDRYITPREAATIMGFPLDFEFSPGLRAMSEIGRGLCVHNARFVGDVIHHGLYRGWSVHVPKPGSVDTMLEVIDMRLPARSLPSVKMKPSEVAAWMKAKHG